MGKSLLLRAIVDLDPSTGNVTTPTRVTALAKVSQFAFGDASLGITRLGAFGLAVGIVPVTVPNLHGDTTAQAGAALNAVGLFFGSVTYSVDLTCENIGEVIRQSPAAGSQVNRGSAVSVTFATAPRPPRECP